MRTIHADRLAIDAMLGNNFRAVDGDIEVLIDRRGGRGINGYRVNQLQGFVWVNITTCTLDEWFARLGPEISILVLAVQDRVPGYRGSIFGNRERQVNRQAYELAKDALRKAAEAIR